MMCKQISGVFFFRPDAMSSIQIFVLTRCNVATGRSFAKCGHHRLRTLRALFGGRGESRVTRKPGGFDLKVIPIANPPRRIGQPTTFPSQTPYTWKGESYAGASVGREQEWNNQIISGTSGTRNLASLRLPQASLVKWVREKHISSS